MPDTWLRLKTTYTGESWNSKQIFKILHLPVWKLHIYAQNTEHRNLIVIIMRQLEADMSINVLLTSLQKEN